jgi:hypothetical protein
MHYIIGIDDTDNHESRGTGHLAREIAKALAQDFHVHGVTRHQLLEDERVPKTAKNSCAAILFEGEAVPLEELAEFARKMMRDDFQPGSDPGLCVVSVVPDEVITFGQRARREFLYQQEPRNWRPRGTMAATWKSARSGPWKACSRLLMFLRLGSSPSKSWMAHP